MPRCARRHAGRPSRDSPRYVIVPATGVTNREIALKSVVLPAPFGPITPTIWLARTVSDTPSRATTPSKRTSIPATSRTAGVAPGVCSDTREDYAISAGATCSKILITVRDPPRCLAS